MDSKRKPGSSRGPGPQSKRARTNDFDDVDPSVFEEELALMEQIEAEMESQGTNGTAHGPSPPPSQAQGKLDVTKG